MIFLKRLSAKNTKRLIRPEYAHHQATPYDVSLHESLWNDDGSFRTPLAADTTPLTRSADAFVWMGGLVPGTVMVRTSGETVAVATGANTAMQPFGLLANFVGGDADDIRDINIGTTKAGVWRGVDSTYTLLAPAWDDTGLASAYSAATAGIPVPLYAGTDGRLVYNSSPGSRVLVAHLIDRPAASRISVDLKV